MLENIEIKPFTDNKGEVFIPEIRSTRLFEFVEAAAKEFPEWKLDRKSTRLNSSHSQQSRMPSSA